MNPLQHYVNHVSILIDASSSMQRHARLVPRIFDRVIADLKKESTSQDQETRVSIYTFASFNNINCLIFDQDVMRTKPIGDNYKAWGNTALRDCLGLALEDAGKIPEKYGDHAHIVYLITDGEENDSKVYPSLPAYNRPFDKLIEKIRQLPSNYTLVGLVPDADCKSYLQSLDIPAGNIQLWDASSTTSLETSNQVFAASAAGFMRSRSAGVRRSANFFHTDLTGKTSAIGKKDVPELSPRDFTIAQNRYPNTFEIRDFVQGKDALPGMCSGVYRPGSAFYLLMKPEKISSVKRIIFRNQKSGKFYGGAGSRGLLGLPDHEVKVTPGNHAGFDIFVESTSYNRHVIPGMEVLVLNPGVTI